jgi:hypothetical protein
MPVIDTSAPSTSAQSLLAASPTVGTRRAAASQRPRFEWFAKADQRGIACGGAILLVAVAVAGFASSLYILAPPPENVVSPPDESHDTPKVTPKAAPVYKHKKVHELLVKIIDPERHQDEFRKLYTEIATCVDQRWSGRWLIGSANTRDGQAYYLTTKEGEKLYKQMNASEVAAAQLSPGEFRHLLPRVWQPPAQLSVKIELKRSVLETYTDDVRKATIEFNYTGSPPEEMLELNACLKLRMSEGEGDASTLLTMQDERLPPSPLELAFRLLPEASIEEPAKLYLEAYLPTPDARYYRISNIALVDLAHFNLALGHEADVIDIQNKLASIYEDDSEPLIVSMTAEIAAAMRSDGEVRWVVRGGSTRDGEPWEIIVSKGKWLSQVAQQPRPDDLSGGGASRDGDPFAGLAERFLYKLADARLEARQPSSGKPWRITGTLQFQLQRAEPVDHLMLVYRARAEADSPIDFADTYQRFPNDADLPQGEQSIEFLIPPSLKPAKGSELFLIGFVQNEDEELEIFQLSNRLAWPE